MKYFWKKDPERLLRYKNKIRKILFSKKFILKYVQHKINKDIFFIPTNHLHRKDINQFLDSNPVEKDTYIFIKKLMPLVKGDLVHAGCYLGEMLPSMSRSLCSGNKLYCFDPIFQHYFCSRKVIKANNLRNTIIFHCALSDELGSGGLNTFDNKKNLLASRSSVKKSLENEVTFLKIDNLAIKDVGCIHLDIEGHEYFALKGAEITIEKSKPVILIEDEEKKLAPFLKKKGYFIFKELSALVVWVHPTKEKLIQSLR